MKLDYGTQISYSPIALSIGHIRKPTLQDISDLSFDKFNYYEILLGMTPETYYNNSQNESDKSYWESLTEEQKSSMNMFDIILSNQAISNIYLEVFNFFFVENVVYGEGYFIILKNDEAEDNSTADNIAGVISKEIFPQVVEIIQRICCIYEEEEPIEEMKFKNALARKLYERMQKAKKKERKTKGVDLNFTLPNLISSISSKHPSLNYTNIWGLTVFQLLDTFNRMRVNSVYEIDKSRVSVWGDEKKTFDISLWYKNDYDKK